MWARETTPEWDRETQAGTREGALQRLREAPLEVSALSELHFLICTMGPKGCWGLCMVRTMVASTRLAHAWPTPSTHLVLDTCQGLFCWWLWVEGAPTVGPAPPLEARAPLRCGWVPVPVRPGAGQRRAPWALARTGWLSEWVREPDTEAPASPPGSLVRTVAWPYASPELRSPSPPQHIKDPLGVHSPSPRVQEQQPPEGQRQD